MTAPEILSVPTAAITLLTGFLMYRFKMIDDREKDTFQRFRNFVQRHRLGPNYTPVISKEYDATEIETWLDKDIPYNIFTHYKCHPHADDALDYYRDYKDCETDKRDISIVIAINLVYLLFYKPATWPIFLNYYVPFAIMFLFYFVCFKKHTVSIFNNSIVNTFFNKKAITTREETAKMIVNDFKEPLPFPCFKGAPLMNRAHVMGLLIFLTMGLTAFLAFSMKAVLALECLGFICTVPTAWFVFKERFIANFTDQCKELLSKGDFDYDKEIRLDQKLIAKYLFGVTGKTGFTQIFSLTPNEITKRMKYDKSDAVRGLVWYSISLFYFLLAILRQVI